MAGSAATATGASASRFAFDEDLEVTLREGQNGRFTADISDRWHIGDKLNGGFLLSLAAKAMGASISEASNGSHPHVLTITGHYLRPGDAGLTEIETEVVRVGRTLSTATASVAQGGKERIRAIASFGDLDDAVGLTRPEGSPPELPPVEKCFERRKDKTLPMNDQAIREWIDTRMHPDTGFIIGRPRSGSPVMRGYLRFTDGREPDVWSLPLFADAMPPPITEVMEDRIWVPTVELTVHVRGVPAPGWLRCVTWTRFISGGFFEEDGEIWDSDNQLVAVSRQLAMVLRP